MTPALLNTAELADLNPAQTVIFDCRFALADPEQGERQYREGHIPGARYLHLDRDLSGPLARHGGRHPLPSAEAFTALMQSHGVNRDTLVIAYDDQRFAFGARLWWLLRYFGHHRVQLLDGGLRAWVEAGRPTTREVAAADRIGDFSASPGEGWVVDYEDVKARLNDSQRVLIDSREARRYLGLEEPIDPVAGHIPGAGNFPWQEVTDEHGVALPPSLQQKRWEDLPEDGELVVYCGSGVTACVNLLSLELAGIDGAKLYAGSWSDWCARMNSE